METTEIKLSPVNIEARKKLDIRSGDTVRVHLKIQEKDKTRIQVFEGLVLAVKHGKESGGTFTVRKVMSGVGVEKIFPIYSPVIDKVEIVKRSKVRRSKLYYIREKVAREVRRKMRRMISAPAVIDESIIEEEIKEESPEVKTEATPESPKEEATETEVKEEEKGEEKLEPEKKEEVKEDVEVKEEKKD